MGWFIPLTLFISGLGGKEKILRDFRPGIGHLTAIEPDEPRCAASGVPNHSSVESNAAFIVCFIATQDKSGILFDWVYKVATY